MDTHSPLGAGYQLSAYFVGLFFIGCLYGSQVFSALNRKREAIQYLMVPASILEKLLCGLFFGVVLFFIAYTLLFYLVDIPMVHLAQRIIAKRGVPVNSPNAVVVVYNVFANGARGIPDAVGPLLLLAFFAVQAAFILGSVYFTRYAVLKTIIGGLVVCLLAVFFMAKVIEGSLPDGWRMEGLFDWRSFDEGSEVQFVRLPEWIKGILYAIMAYSLPLIFWFITYFRLKEKEV